jgi:hypothetical protein
MKIRHHVRSDDCRTKTVKKDKNIAKGQNPENTQTIMRWFGKTGIGHRLPLGCD